MSDELEHLLADYAAPLADDGFSDAVMAQLPRASVQGRFELGARAPRWPWREALVAACLGGTGWLAWERLSERVELVLPQMSVPEIALDPTGLTGAALCGLLLCGWLGLQWLEG